jgi:methanol dehydrogenase (cytochrome c) subunit 1
VFDLTDPTAGLGAVGAFKNLQKYTQMGGGVQVFSLNGKNPYDDVNVGEWVGKGG